MKNKILIIVIIIIALVVIMSIFISTNKNVGTSNIENVIAKDISTEIKSETIDFSNYNTYDIVLNNKTVDIAKEGVYHLTGSIANGYLHVNTAGNVQIILDNVSITNETGPAIYIENAKLAYICLKENTINTLIDGANYIANDENMDGTIYSKDDLIIEGKGILNITANYADGIVGKDSLSITDGVINVTSKDDGIRGKDYVYIKSGKIIINATGDGIKSTNAENTELGYIYIENGEFNIISESDGIQAESYLQIENGEFNIKTGGGSQLNSSNINNDWGQWQKMPNNTTTESEESIKGIKGGTSVLIKQGNINIDSFDDAIHSNGIVQIENGTIYAQSGDDGIHADTKLEIQNGDITIAKSYEGMESSNIIINNVTIHITSSDDGLNVSGGNDTSATNGRMGNDMFTVIDGSLIINSGYIYIDASGDGLDSNGNIYMYGGIVIVNGPTNSGNGAIDYNGEFIIDGGILIAAGSMGMAEVPTNNSSINILNIGFNEIQNANTIVNISDSEGNSIVTFAPSKKFQSIIVSTSDLKIGETYTINYGGMETGESKDGLYSSGTYTGGTKLGEYKISNVITNINSNANGNFKGGGMNPKDQAGGRMP